jgi:hypothetical protein
MVRIAEVHSVQREALEIPEAGRKSPFFFVIVAQNSRRHHFLARVLRCAQISYTLKRQRTSVHVICYRANDSVCYFENFSRASGK